MKKLLSLLGAVSLTAIGTSNIISCHKEEKIEDIIYSFVKKIDEMFENSEIKQKIIENIGQSEWDKLKNDWDIKKQNFNFNNIDFSTISEQEKNLVIKTLKSVEELLNFYLN